MSKALLKGFQLALDLMMAIHIIVNLISGETLSPAWVTLLWVIIATIGHIKEKV